MFGVQCVTVRYCGGDLGLSVPPGRGKQGGAAGHTEGPAADVEGSQTATIS